MMPYSPCTIGFLNSYSLSQVSYPPHISLESTFLYLGLTPNEYNRKRPASGIGGAPLTKTEVLILELKVMYY